MTGKVSLEARVLAALDPHEGTESFNLGLAVGPNLWMVRSALQRLRKKGLAEAVRCSDGAWVWFSLVDDPS